jgi:hypothetical protein
VDHNHRDAARSAGRLPEGDQPQIYAINSLVDLARQGRLLNLVRWTVVDIDSFYASELAVPRAASGWERSQLTSGSYPRSRPGGRLPRRRMAWTSSLLARTRASAASDLARAACCDPGSDTFLHRVVIASRAPPNEPPMPPDGSGRGRRAAHHATALASVPLPGADGLPESTGAGVSDPDRPLISRRPRRWKGGVCERL